MYGDALVDLETAQAAASVKAADVEDNSEPGGIRKTGSWQLTNKEGHGMHVTFQVGSPDYKEALMSRNFEDLAVAPCAVVLSC